ncbi:hypothetical protein SAMN05720354_10911 [Nitrosospira sp. Nsp1]|nr:hypothetical protein SAMN05720354_10911 [Nitrosospira sp. Nsp1]
MNLGKESKRMRSLYFSRRRAHKTDSCKSAIKQRQHPFRESEVFLNHGRADSICLQMVLSLKTPRNDKALLSSLELIGLAHLIRIFR